MKPEGQLQIEIKDEVASGKYANLAIIAHSSSEFVIDFICMMPNVTKAQVKSRIIMTPEHAKRLTMALLDNIKRYEAQFGAIKIPEMPSFAPVPKYKGDA
jgi:hypothetical protein